MHRMLLVGFAVLGFASPSGAWGSDGHRIVCEMAWQSLDAKTRKAASALLPDGPYESFAQACTWADRTARRDERWAWVAPLHYIDADLSLPRVTLTRKNCPDGACVVAAIERFTRELHDTSLPRWQRIRALRLVGHFVGDLHQPLHVAHRDQCGGCSVKILFGRRRDTLHRIWDTRLIDLYQEPYVEAGARSSRAWQELAADLSAQIRVDERRAWSASLVPLTWADESLDLARHALFQLPGASELPEDYAGRAFPWIAQRLQQAGVRLAALLRIALGPGPLPF